MFWTVLSGSVLLIAAVGALVFAVRRSTVKAIKAQEAVDELERQQRANKVLTAPRNRKFTSRRLRDGSF